MSDISLKIIRQANKQKNTTHNDNKPTETKPEMTQVSRQTY